MFFIGNGRQYPHIQTGLRTTSTPPEPNHVQTTRDQTTVTNETLQNKSTLWRCLHHLAKEGCEPEHLCVPILYAYQTKHLFYRPCPAAKHNVIPPSCYELLHTTPLTTFHSSTTPPSESPHRGAETKRVPNDLIRIPHSSVRCLRRGRSLRTPVR